MVDARAAAGHGEVHSVLHCVALARDTVTTAELAKRTALGDGTAVPGVDAVVGVAVTVVSEPLGVDLSCRS